MIEVQYGKWVSLRMVRIVQIVEEEFEKDERDKVYPAQQKRKASKQCHRTTPDDNR